MRDVNVLWRDVVRRDVVWCVVGCSVVLCWFAVVLTTLCCGMLRIDAMWCSVPCCVVVCRGVW